MRLERVSGQGARKEGARAGHRVCSTKQDLEPL